MALLSLLLALPTLASATSVLSPLLDSPYAAPASSTAGGASASASANSASATVFVDCSWGADSTSGSSFSNALKTLPKALATGAGRIEVSGGMCPLSAALLLDRAVVLHGDGKTALSGGKTISGWTPSANHPGGKVMVADVADFPLPEIKMLRLGGGSLRRSRWPKLVGDGLTTSNFAFAMPVSCSSNTPNTSPIRLHACNYTSPPPPPKVLVI